ncbi:hypothetical protein PYCC9005_005653 [Savitreella phatthalungensis]
MDDVQVSELIRAASSQPSSDECAELLTGLLGMDPPALTFISEFCSRRYTAPKANDRVHVPASASKASGQRSKHSQSQQHQQLQPQKGSSNADPAPLPVGNTAGTMTSELGKKKARTTTQPTRKVDALSEIDAAIRELELTDKTSSTANGDDEHAAIRCDCAAQRHGLNTVSPNCLSCGKVICALESPIRCSFCGSELMSVDATRAMLAELRRERGAAQAAAKQVRRKAAAGSMPRGAGVPGSMAYSGKVGANFGTTASLDEETVREKADAAQKRKDDLLQHVRSGARRTVVDRASDFDRDAATASDRWVSPQDRALALRRHLADQKAREVDANRGTRVLRIDLSGKATAGKQRIGLNDGGKLGRETRAEDVDRSLRDDEAAAAAAKEEQMKRDRAEDADRARQGFPRNVLSGDIDLVFKKHSGHGTELLSGPMESSRGKWFKTTHGDATWNRLQDDNDDDDNDDDDDVDNSRYELAA